MKSFGIIFFSLVILASCASRKANERKHPATYLKAEIVNLTENASSYNVVFRIRNKARFTGYYAGVVLLKYYSEKGDSIGTEGFPFNDTILPRSKSVFSGAIYRIQGTKNIKIDFTTGIHLVLNAKKHSPPLINKATE